MNRGNGGNAGMRLEVGGVPHLTMAGQLDYNTNTNIHAHSNKHGNGYDSGNGIIYN